MMVSNGWKPVDSNAVIKATCAKNRVFEQAYLAASDGLRPAKGAGVHTVPDVVIERKGKQEVTRSRLIIWRTTRSRLGVSCAPARRSCNQRKLESATWTKSSTIAGRKSSHCRSVLRL